MGIGDKLTIQLLPFSPALFLVLPGSLVFSFVHESLE
jgi:hypothetical protein